MKIFNLLLAAARTAAERMIPRLQYEPTSNGVHLLAVLSTDTGKGALRVYVATASGGIDLWVTLNAKHNGTNWIADQVAATAHAIRYSSYTLGTKPIEYLVDTSPAGNITWASKFSVTSAGDLVAVTLDGDHTGSVAGLDVSYVRPLAGGLIHLAKPAGGSFGSPVLTSSFGSINVSTNLSDPTQLITTIALASPPTFYIIQASGMYVGQTGPLSHEYALLPANNGSQSPVPGNFKRVVHKRADGGSFDADDAVDVYLQFLIHKV